MMPTLRPTQLLTAIALLFCPSALAQISTSNTACTRHYVVKDGDTCDIIGQKTLTSTYQIMSLNLPDAGPNCYTLTIGAQLCLGTYGNDCQMVHRSQGNEDCSTIASQYGISQATLRRNNPSLDCDVVYDGLMLCVIPGTIRPPSPDTALNLTANANDNITSYVATMPLGDAVTATNAEQAGPHTVQVVTVQPSATSTTEAAKRHVHLNGANHHHNAAKRYQASQSVVTANVLP